MVGYLSQEWYHIVIIFLLYFLRGWTSFASGGSFLRGWHSFASIGSFLRGWPSFASIGSFLRGWPSGPSFGVGPRLRPSVSSFGVGLRVRPSGLAPGSVLRVRSPKVRKSCCQNQSVFKIIHKNQGTFRNASLYFCYLRGKKGGSHPNDIVEPEQCR